jgi:hypothetical protein
MAEKRTFSRVLSLMDLENITVDGNKTYRFTNGTPGSPSHSFLEATFKGVPKEDWTSVEDTYRSFFLPRVTLEYPMPPPALEEIFGFCCGRRYLSSSSSN